VVFERDTQCDGAISSLSLAARPRAGRSRRARSWTSERVPRIAILWRGDATEGFVRALQGALRDELAKLGWIEGRNVQLELRYSGDDRNRMRTHADELVGLSPDLIVASSFPVAQAVLQRIRTIPVVFVNVGDPVAGGLLQNIARPEGNVTGITSVYQSMGGKWLELLKEAAPRTTRVALIFASENVNDQFFGVINATAEALAMKAVRTPYRTAAELERAIHAFATDPNGALLMVPPPPTVANGELINGLALKYRLPTIYSSKYYVAQGGLISLGAPIVQSYQIAATYIDRILRGAKINELPVQFPSKVEMAINLKTAKAIGLTLSRTFLARADDLIE
jgi:putative ABC transport system substrate-binding protein